jgi:hypothetical protein
LRLAIKVDPNRTTHGMILGTPSSTIRGQVLKLNFTPLVKYLDFLALLKVLSYKYE